MKLTGNLVAHAENPVPTLQKGDKTEWPHDVVRQRRGWPEAELPLHVTVVRVESKVNALGRKLVLFQSGLRTVPADKAALAGEGDVPMLLFCDHLDGTGLAATTGVNSGNQGQCLGRRLALEVPSAKMIPMD